MSVDVERCEFVPLNEPWECRVHRGVRTSLDEPQCDIARPAEPFNDAYLDNIRQGIAEGRNPSSRYITRRLLATVDANAARLAQAEAERERLDVERLTRALRPVTRHLFVAGGDKGYEKWLADTAEKVAREYGGASE